MLRFYLDYSPISAYNKANFNTSHVTVLFQHLVQQLPMQNISIHLMLRFYASSKLYFVCTCKISIHLMLRFYLQSLYAIFIDIGISIHLMLRFYSNAILSTISANLFQYISCYGSIPFAFLNFTFIYWISIHLMLRFYILISIK